MKESKCANYRIFTGMVAPGVAKGGSLSPRLRALIWKRKLGLQFEMLKD